VWSTPKRNERARPQHCEAIEAFEGRLRAEVRRQSAKVPPCDRRFSWTRVPEPPWGDTFGTVTDWRNLSYSKSS